MCKSWGRHSGVAACPPLAHHCPCMHTPLCPSPRNQYAALNSPCPHPSSATPPGSPPPPGRLTNFNLQFPQVLKDPPAARLCLVAADAVDAKAQLVRAAPRRRDRFQPVRRRAALVVLTIAEREAGQRRRILLKPGQGERDARLNVDLVLAQRCGGMHVRAVGARSRGGGGAHREGRGRESAWGRARACHAGGPHVCVQGQHGQCGTPMQHASNASRCVHCETWGCDDAAGGASRPPFPYYYCSTSLPA